MRHEIYTIQSWLQNCHENMAEAEGCTLQLAEVLIDLYGSYPHQDDETLGRQARELALHLPKSLLKIYSSLRSD